MANCAAAVECNADNCVSGRRAVAVSCSNNKVTSRGVGVFWRYPRFSHAGRSGKRGDGCNLPLSVPFASYCAGWLTLSFGWLLIDVELTWYCT
jgi:hypothetical protein